MTISGRSEGTPTATVQGETRWFDRPLIWLVCGIGIIGALFLLVVPHFYMPAEDAIILFQFSRNLAHTGAITYIPYGPHAEGATDFAWMVLIGAAIKLGLEPFWVVAVINFTGLLAFSAVLVRLATARVSAIALLFAIGGFALMPQLWSAAAGFSTIPFALLLLLLIRAVLEEQDAAAPMLGLLLCLFRPDGVVFAVPLLIAALIAFPHPRRKVTLDLALFVVPGLAYFLWRWHYFGELLPLPFLVKSDAVRVGHYLVVDSLQEARNLLVFALAILFVVLRGRLSDVKNRIVLFCVIVLPTLFYLGMRLDQDVGRRFFIYLPVGVAVLIARNWEALRSRQALALRVGLAAWLLCIFTTTFKEAHGSKSFQLVNRRDVSVGLGQIPHGTLLATEAGIAPYYSGWATYDSWGLSTAQFARHLLQPEDVRRLNADVLLIHSGMPPNCEIKPGWKPQTVRTWDNMVANFVDGADPSLYQLWYVPRGDAGKLDRGAEPSEVDWDCWYVRKDSALRGAVENDLLRHHGISKEQYQASLASEATASASRKTGSKPSLMGRIKRIWHKIA